MGMKNRNYPIIIGHKYKKGIMALRDGNGFRFLVCRLSKECKTGDVFDLSDVESVEVELWFTDRKALETTVGMMNRILTECK